MPRTKLQEKHVRETRTERPKRTPVGGYRDKLTVHYKDEKHREKFADRWVLDTHENGPRILAFKDALWEFVPAEEATIGVSHVLETEGVGSIIRRPAGGNGQYLYLMRLPREYYDEDQAEKQKYVDATEEDLTRPDSLSQDIDEGGVYGSIKIS